MQNDSGKIPLLPRSDMFPDIVDSGRMSGKDAAMDIADDVEEEKKDDEMFGLGDDNKKQCNDIVMEDIDVGLIANMNDVQETRNEGKTVFEDGPVEKKGGNVHGVSLDSGLQQMEDDGARDGDTGSDESGDVNNQKNSSTSWESSQETNFDFNFDSDEEMEEKNDNVSKGVASFGKTLDLDLLRDYVDRGEETLRCIEGKDVTVVVGKTGTGKSSLIQGIAGKQFIQSTYSCGAGEKVASKKVFDAVDPLSGFEIGHAKSSKTKHIRYHIIDQGASTSKMYYLDTPGFEDTEGEEVDISTSAMLRQISKKSRSIRFIVMINYVSLLDDRGGVIRSTLKFIRNFVREFEKHKQSFMFLFSHVDQISTVPECLKEAKKSLLDEIIFTMEGTKSDDDGRDILRFIKKSLEKNYPFVGVFHPLKTDFSAISSKVKSLRSIKVADENIVSSFLTNSSRMRLIGATRCLQVNLRLQLGKNPIDIEAVHKIQKTFLFFEKYFDFEEMRTAVADCNETIDRHIKHLHEILTEQVKIGTSVCKNSLFTERNVLIVKDTIEKLNAIDSSRFEMQNEYSRIRRQVKKFQQALLLNKTSKFHGYGEKLGKLKAWCVLDSHFQEMFNEIIAQGNKVVQQVVEVIANFDPCGVFSPPDIINKITEVSSLLGVLKSIHENTASLSSYLTGIKDASDEYLQFSHRLKRYFETVNMELSSSTGFQGLDISDSHSIRRLSNRIQSMEKISALIDDSYLKADILPLARDAKDSIETQVVDHFSKTCTSIEVTLRSGFNEHLHHTFVFLRDAVTALSTCESDRWKDMKSVYDATIDKLTSCVKTKAIKMNEMSQLLLKHGVTCGKQDAEAIKSFARWRWVDEILPREKRFVESCLQAIREKYFHRYIAVTQNVKETLFRLSDDTKSSESEGAFVDAMKELGRKIVEIDQFTHFCSVTRDDQLRSLLTQLFDEFYDCVRRRASAWRKILEAWIELIHSEDNGIGKITGATKALDSAMGEIEEIISMPLGMAGKKINALARSIKNEEILSALSNFGKNVQQSLESQKNQKDYNELAILIARVRALGNFRNTAPYLPKVEDLKQEARELVARDAKRIEQMMEREPCAKQVDEILASFEKASILSQFIPEEVTCCLRPLKRIRTEKSLQSKVQKSIEVIDTFLKKASEECQYEIYSEVNEENGTKVASSLQILENATGHEESVRIFENRINEVHCKLHDKLGVAINSRDFTMAHELNQRASCISVHLIKHLTQESKNKMEANSLDYVTVKSSISKHIDIFIESFFTESRALEKLLYELRRAVITHEPNCEDLSRLYDKSKQSLFDQVKDHVEAVRKSCIDTQCFDDSIFILKNLVCCLEKGLKEHLPQVIVDDSKTLIKRFAQERKEQEHDLDFGRTCVEMTIKEYTKKLDSASSSTFWKFISGNWKESHTYERLKMKLEDEIKQRHDRGCRALEGRDFNTLSKGLEFLRLVDLHSCKHVHSAGEKLSDLERKANESFQVHCKTCQDVLQGINHREFESLFPDFRGFVLNITCLMKDPETVSAFHLVNQFVFECLNTEISSLETTIDSFDFIAIKEKIEHLRQFGGFIADNYSLFHEQLKAYRHVPSDESLDFIRTCILQNFQRGRNLEKIKFYAILEVRPSANKTEVTKAYRKKSVRCHPDKCKDERLKQEWSNKFLMLKEAYDEVKEVRLSQSLKPFDDNVHRIAIKLKIATKKALNQQHYDGVETLLFKLQGLDAIQSLVKPKLDTRKINSSVFSLVKAHVQKIRTEIDTNWSERKFRELNCNIKDLKMMENELKSYPKIFPTSWNTGIIKKVETEIDELGKEAKALLEDVRKANGNRDEFRRCFLKMGAVLVELPEFKDYTKKVMSDLLELCLNSNWGYSFVFELGLSLQKGGRTEDGNDVGDARIAMTLVSEFQHFKEVLTMVWNEETIQKPPEETIKGLFGQLLGSGSIDTACIQPNTAKLIDQYVEFDSLYTSFLGEYLVPEADIRALVQKTIKACETLKPVSCDDGFGTEMKGTLPTILAGIFAVFTVLKSGESYQRLEEDSNLNSIDAKKVLMKPHNIQIFALFCMFGCGMSDSDSLRSQLMQIRTGEGKSMILGAAAVVFGLLDFRVRCVCYSEYLSARDHELFHDVFAHFGLSGMIKYSKITGLSEDTTAAKGNIRDLTLSLLHGTLPNSKAINSALDVCTTPTQVSTTQYSPDILLIDEVDIFFGSDFYGQTYNQVAQLKEPEITSIMKQIWEMQKQKGKRILLDDIKVLPEYKNLLLKIPGFDYLFENEIILMLDQAKRVDNEPLYCLNPHTDKIGYKVHDTISYNVTYGYRTAFAYLKEADNGNLKDPNATLSRVLTMPISCGQFSYANIRPTRILGVSGTLEFMSEYEKAVLQSYGVNQYLYLPSVYGKSNFDFDKNGNGVTIEKSVGDFFHRITQEISNVATKEKRAVIVFFGSSKRLKEYTTSAYYRKLGRQKNILTENKTKVEKEFVISKAATAGQITICTPVFGRGTDFFCKDGALENNGGVHVIQAFLSANLSEEVQIQGRTARQGKKGSYELILLEEDLEVDFSIEVGSIDRWPKSDYYTNLCEARQKALKGKYAMVDSNLLVAKEKDENTHNYFDALLASNCSRAETLFKDLYLNMKKAKVEQINIDLAFAIDVTGSMDAYKNAITSTVESLLVGPSSILTNFKTEFQGAEFALRVAVLGYRDIDDKNKQFEEFCFNGTSHFSDNMQEVLRHIETLTSSTSGGSDIAEDHLGAINHCINWNSTGDWEGTFKAILVITDAPAHGYAPKNTIIKSTDNYSARHPLGLSVDSVAEELIEKDIDLFVCSFVPAATSTFVEAMQKKYSQLSPIASRGVNVVSLLPTSNGPSTDNWITSDCRKHNIFVLDESGSMSNDWAGVVSVYNQYIRDRRQRQRDADLVSIVQFDGGARVTCQMEELTNVPDNLDFLGGGTMFGPAAITACDIFRQTPPSHTPVMIFMSDGMTNDYQSAASTFASLNQEFGGDFELHVIGFGNGTDTAQLQTLARSSPKGRVHMASNIDSLLKVFVEIADGGDAVANVLEAELGKRVSDAVRDRLSAEYF